MTRIILATDERDRTSAFSWPQRANLCGVAIEEPGTAMLLELFRRRNAGVPTEVCDLIGLRPSPVAKGYRALDQLLTFGLIIVTTTGRRFRRVELSERAFDQIEEWFRNSPEAMARPWSHSRCDPG
jgi:hypothetical protein